MIRARHPADGPDQNRQQETQQRAYSPPGEGRGDPRIVSGETGWARPAAVGEIKQEEGKIGGYHNGKSNDTSFAGLRKMPDQRASAGEPVDLTGRKNSQQNRENQRERHHHPLSAIIPYASGREIEFRRKLVRMRWVWIAIMCCGCAAAGQTGVEKIEAYQGTWKIETEHLDTRFSKAGKESSTLRNDCWRSAGFFVCDQFVNGESKALIAFTYDPKDEIFHSYSVPAGGEGGGGGKLVIKGNVWTFPWEQKEDGKTVYFRVVN